MKKSFITGNFLPAYGSKFGVVDRGKMARQLDDERLAERFAARASTFRERKTSYRQGILAGLVFSLAAAGTLFNIPWTGSEQDSFAVAIQETVQMEEIAQTQQLEKPPPPPRPPVPVEVPNDAILEADDLDLDASLDLDEPLADLPPPPPAPATEVVDEEPELFYVVEDMPELIGGVAALVASLDYPPLARKAGLEGVVVVQVVIQPDGSPSDPSILKSVAPLLDKAALKAVMEQTFTPGKQRGRAVPVAMNIPVAFRLT